MANLPETATFDAGVYMIPTTDPVVGGTETAISNKQAKALADRTAYLKAHVDTLETEVAGILTTLAAALTTPAAGDDSAAAATTAFVHRAAGGFASVDCSGAGNIPLSADQWGAAVIILTGARTANGNVIFPTRAGGDRWLIVNRTSGAFSLTCKTAAGAGVKVAQTRSKDAWCDGTDILDAETDLSIRPRVITGATLLAAGDDVIIDQSGGAFATTLPAAPAAGDRISVSGNFLSVNHTVARNGNSIIDENGVAQASDALLNRNSLKDAFTWAPTLGGWLWTRS